MFLLQLIPGVHAATLTICPSPVDTGTPGCDHTTLASGVAAALANDTLAIIGTVEVTGPVNVSTAITIDGMGTGELRFLTAGDLTLAGPVTIASLDLDLGSSTLTTSGAVVLENVRISGLDGLGPLVLATEGTLAFVDSALSDRNRTEGSGALLESTGATITAVDTDFRNGTASTGGAVNIASGLFDAERCVFEGNTATDAAGALHAEATAQVILEDCLFVDNTTTGNGGAIEAHGSVTVRSSRLCANTATDAGGAIWVDGSTSLRNSLLFGNSAADGGAIHSFDPTATYRNNTFVDNGAPTAGAIDAAGAIRNNLFIGTTGGITSAGPLGTYNAYFDNASDPAEPTSLTVDPEVTGSGCAFPVPRPWSPLIDAGDPAIVDPDQTRSDIGAHGGPSGSPTLFGDSDADGVVELLDCDDEDLSVGTFDVSFVDADSDGFGDPVGDTFPSCTPVLMAGDCDDSDPEVSPAATEVCGDFIDNDCDGMGGSPADDEDGDSLDSEAEQLLGTDVCLADTDADGIDDPLEGSVDTDGDTIIDPLDPDDDGDTLPTLAELGLDTDGDLLPDHLDNDDDNDGLLSMDEDVDGDGDLLDDDTDGDGRPNFRDADDDDDGIDTAVEIGLGMPWLDADADDDGVLDGDEFLYGDSDFDGTPDWQDPDDDNDGIPTLVEGNGDADGDGVENHRDQDADGNGIGDAIEGATADADADGVPDFLDTWDQGAGGDDDLDLLPNSLEISIGSDPTNPDTDGDGRRDGEEATFGAIPPDTDGDGTLDLLDPDDDGDTVPTLDEVDGDTDGDGTIDALDDDDDDDGIPTADEDWNANGTVLDDDRDGDGIIDYLDDMDAPADTDGDGVSDDLEALFGTDPTLADTDGDGRSDSEELAGAGAGGTAPDLDGDGIIDALDPDDDGDGLPTIEETPGDFDADGLDNASDPDADNDGVADGRENRDADGDGRPDHLDAGGSVPGTPSQETDYGFGCSTSAAPTSTALGLLGLLGLLGARRR